MDAGTVGAALIGLIAGPPLLLFRKRLALFGAAGEGHLERQKTWQRMNVFVGLGFLGLGIFAAIRLLT
jgi:hypothetical protein